MITARAHMAGSVRAAGGRATSTPAAGPTGATITVNGSGWQGMLDGTAVTFGYSIGSSCTSSYVAATVEQVGNTSSGAFSGWFRWPDATPTGVYTVCASIGPTMAVAGTYTVLSSQPPQLSISASTLNVGQKAVVTGSNFQPAQTSISLVLQQLNGGARAALGKVISDVNGAFSQAYTIPNSLTGPLVLIANGGSGTPPALTASVTFIVYAKPGTPMPRPTPSPQPTPTATPVQNAATPTAIQAQAVTPAPTTAATPNTGNRTTQQTASTTGNGHRRIITVTLIAGLLFLALVAAIAGLLVRKRRRATKQRTAPFNGNAQAVQATPSWNPLQNPSNPAAPVPFAAQPETPPYRIPVVAGTASRPQDGRSGGYPGGVSYPAAVGDQNGNGNGNESDLLHDPLFVAIMQQTRAGLFVLPGKREK